MCGCPERWNICLVLAAGLACGAAWNAGRSGVLAAQRTFPDMQKVFADSDWYVERSEAEEERRGILRERTVTLGPASRVSASLELIVEGRKPMPVYAGNIKPQLAKYVGRRVTLRGKLVDLTREGYDEELWIGWIRLDE